jgi:peroxiredoxin
VLASLSSAPTTATEETTMPAPDFTLPDQAGQPWTLSAQRGAAVALVFLRGDW